MTISEIKNKYTAGTTVVEIVEQAKAALINTSDLNASLGLYSDQTISECISTATRLMREGKATLLTGVPIIIKDNILVKGEKATAGSKMLEKYTSPYDATIITKLRSAGAILLARSNMDEFAMGSSTEHSAFGPTKNPLDKECVPGGSSGGSAALVSASVVAVSLGSDTGGSIRQPAAFCGVVGLKPTYGHVSRYGVIAMASSLDQVGPFATNVADAKILYDTIKGEDKKDATTLSDLETAKSFTAKKVIGVPRNFINQPGMDKNILTEFEQSLKDLENIGYKIIDIDLPSFDKALAMYYIVCPAEVSSNMGRFDGVRYGFNIPGKTPKESFEKSRTEGLGEEVRRRILLGTYVLSSGYYDAYYRRAENARSLLRRDLSLVFENVDVIATPISPVLPWKIGAKLDPLSMYLADVFTVPINMAGVPAITIPTSRNIENFKGSIQFIAPHHGEDTLFTVGSEFEASQRK